MRRIGRQNMKRRCFFAFLSAVAFSLVFVFVGVVPPGTIPLSHFGPRKMGPHGPKRPSKKNVVQLAYMKWGHSTL
nr:hypothetical protein Itr_chr02CG06550 [Ipomoea trifida]